MKYLWFSIIILSVIGCASSPCGPIHKGMTMQEIRACYGPTFCKKDAQFNDEQTEMWGYKTNIMYGTPNPAYDCIQANQKIYFKDGIVVGWENIK